jgi:hypothetical protein
MDVPGDTPMDPVLIAVTVPSKVIALPAWTAKFLHPPRAMLALAADNKRVATANVVEKELIITIELLVLSQKIVNLCCACERKVSEKKDLELVRSVRSHRDDRTVFLMQRARFKIQARKILLSRTLYVQGKNHPST